MDIRYLTDSDYETLFKWWSDWRWTAPNKDFLPEDGKGGLIIHDSDGIPVCAGFLYFTNSKVAWIEFIISNREYKSSFRHTAIRSLIEQLMIIAKDNGFHYIYTSLRNSSLIKKFEDCGFQKGSSNCQEMVFVWQQ